ncbi:MAG: glycerate kinase [Planctomycetota bacterium]
MIPVEIGSGVPVWLARVARTAWKAAMTAADPYEAVKRAWDSAGVPGGDPVTVLAFGKASIAMTRAAVELLGDRVASGCVVCPRGQRQDLGSSVEVYEADHPLPTEANVEAARAMARCAEAASGVCVVLVSGGGSAHLTLPRDGVSLDEIRRVSQDLMRSGADIYELNRARTRLEVLKGGGLGRLLTDCETVAFVLSDVIGDDLATIASGPLVGDGCNARHVVIASNAAAINAVAAGLARDGVGVVEVRRDLVGPAAVAGQELADAVGDLAPGQAVVAGGELVVDVGDATGVGGPCQELALAAGLELPGEDFGVVVFSTDGVDGPTGFAGAAVAGGLEADGRARIERGLMRHDVSAEVERFGLGVRSGATGTNVNDVVVLVRRS